MKVGIVVPGDMYSFTAYKKTNVTTDLRNSWDIARNIDERFVNRKGENVTKYSQ